MKPCDYIPSHPNRKCVFGEGHKGDHIVVYHHRYDHPSAALILRFPNDQR